MTKTEAALKWLEDEYGIKSEAELDKALERTKLDIGIFVSPLLEFGQKGNQTNDGNCTVPNQPPGGETPETPAADNVPSEDHSGLPVRNRNCDPGGRGPPGSGGSAGDGNSGPCLLPGPIHHGAGP